MSKLEDQVSWPLLLRTGFGNVFPHGRWDHGATFLIADAINTGEWGPVEDFAVDCPWDKSTAS